MTRALLSRPRIRLLLVVLLAGGALLPTAPTSQAWPCVLECDIATWFRALQDCVWGPPNTCTACIYVCPREV